MYETTVTWPKGGQGIFHTEAVDVFEAETIVNFLLQRDYHWEGTQLSTVEATKVDEFDVFYGLHNGRVVTV